MFAITPWHYWAIQGVPSLCLFTLWWRDLACEFTRICFCLFDNIIKSETLGCALHLMNTFVHGILVMFRRWSRRVQCPGVDLFHCCCWFPWQVADFNKAQINWFKTQRKQFVSNASSISTAPHSTSVSKSEAPWNVQKGVLKVWTHVGRWCLLNMLQR